MFSQWILLFGCYFFTFSRAVAIKSFWHFASTLIFELLKPKNFPIRSRARRHADQRTVLVCLAVWYAHCDGKNANIIGATHEYSWWALFHQSSSMPIVLVRCSLEFSLLGEQTARIYSQNCCNFHLQRLEHFCAIFAFFGVYWIFFILQSPANFRLNGLSKLSEFLPSFRHSFPTEQSAVFSSVCDALWRHHGARLNTNIKSCGVLENWQRRLWTDF